MRNKMYIYLFGIFACSASCAMNDQKELKVRRQQASRNFLNDVNSFIGSINALGEIKDDSQIPSGRENIRAILYESLVTRLRCHLARGDYYSNNTVYADVNAQYDEQGGKTALMLALDNKKADISDLLVFLAYKGSDLHLKDTHGVSVIDRLKKPENRKAFFTIFSYHKNQAGLFEHKITEKTYYKDALELMKIHKSEDPELKDPEFEKSWVNMVPLDELHTLITGLLPISIKVEEESTPQS